MEDSNSGKLVAAYRKMVQEREKWENSVEYQEHENKRIEFNEKSAAYQMFKEILDKQKQDMLIKMFPCSYSIYWEQKNDRGYCSYSGEEYKSFDKANSRLIDLQNKEVTDHNRYPVHVTSHTTSKLSQEKLFDLFRKELKEMGFE